MKIFDSTAAVKVLMMFPSTHSPPALLQRTANPLVENGGKLDQHVRLEARASRVSTATSVPDVA